MKLLGPTLLILGAILNILALFMLIPMLVAMFYGTENQMSFLISAILTSLSGIGLLLLGRKADLNSIQPRQVFVVTTMSWVAASFFGSIPFMFASPALTFTDAIFETVSGLTTTGSTVIVGLDKIPKGILLWRSLLNWLGGVGVIGMAVAIMPFLRIGGMKLFKTESSEWSDKAVPRVQSLMKLIIYSYVALSICCCLLFWIAGMDFFNAVNHAMASVSTGGFSTSDNSFAQFESLTLHWIAIVFMLAGAVPFVLFVRLIVNKQFVFFKDTQVKGLLMIVAVTTMILTIQLVATEQMDFFRALTMTCFNLVSVITTTGFASGDYSLWGPIALVIFFFATFIGGCSGSTSGGIKVFRLQIFAGLVKEQIITAVHPRAVISRRYNNRLISSEIIASSISYMFLMTASLVVISIILALTGLDLVTSVTGSATALMNVGPGLGPIIGPAGNFSSLSDTAKWALSVGMLLGRLEFLTILVLFTPIFWRA